MKQGKRARSEFPPKLFERIGPGKYREKATGRVYVDSHDMDGAFDRAIDAAAHQDEIRDRHLAELAKRRDPPPFLIAKGNLERLRHVAEMAQRAVTNIRGEKKARLQLLRVKREYVKREYGRDLDDADLGELEALEVLFQRKRIYPKELRDGIKVARERLGITKGDLE